MAYRQTNYAPPDATIRGPDDTGIFCQKELSYNILNFIEKRYDLTSDNFLGLLYKNSLNTPSYALQSCFKNYQNIHSMKIFHEKKASHCLQWMKHDKKLIVGTSKGNLCVFIIGDF